MKITVRNLGMITSSEIDLRPLTVLVGPNNAGKTWLAYLVAGLLGVYGRQKYAEAYGEGKLPESDAILDGLVHDIISKGSASIDLAQLVDQHGEMYLEKVASLAPQWISSLLGSDRINGSNLQIEIRLENSLKPLRDAVISFSTRNHFAFGLNINDALLTARKQPDDPKLYFYTSGQMTNKDFPPEVFLKEFVASALLDAVFQSIYDGIYVFPTERTTFISFQFRKESTSRRHELHEREIVQAGNFANPASRAMSRFLMMTGALYESSLSQRHKDIQKIPQIGRYIELAHLLQTRILGGSLDFSLPEPGPGRELLFTPNQPDAPGIDMAVVSSMVKELASLVLYLRYLAVPGSLIIIDEPEMNLHPEAQAQLIEFLAMLVNSGLQVLITTHSPYMVDHLENLMTASEHPAEGARLREDFFLQDTGAFIKKEKVGVSLISDGTATNIIYEDGHIHWDTFSDVSNRVTRLYSKILEAAEEVFLRQ